MTDKIKMIAHRGYSGRFHENTEQAFLEAARHGSAGAETDIRATKDGVFVCSHNSEIILTDGTELIVADHTFDELTALPLKNKRTDDTVYLCKFERYLEIMKENDMICFVEFKGSFTDSMVKDVFDLVERVYDMKKCILQSFDFDNLVRTHALFPDLGIMWTYGKGESHYESCFDYGFSIDADKWVADEKMVKAFHDRGLEVGVWTANTKEELELCRALGVDYIESDFFGPND